MKKVTSIKVDLVDASEITGYLDNEPTSEEDGFFNETITYTAKFDNGYSADIKLCGVSSYEEGGCNTPWTEMVLFNEKGSELCCTDATDDFFGEWELEYGGDTYCVNVYIANITIEASYQSEERAQMDGYSFAFHSDDLEMDVWSKVAGKKYTFATIEGYC